MPGCVRIFFPVPFVLAGLITIWVAMGDVVGGLSSPDWPQVEGAVTESFVDTHTDEDGDSYTAEVRYRYAVEGVEHTGERVAFTRWNDNDVRDAETVRDRYPVGATIVVYHNPRTHSDAVLEPGLHGGAFGLLAFGSVFALVGLFMVFKFRGAKLDRDADPPSNDRPVTD